MQEWLLALRQGAEQFGLTLTGEQETQFARFLELLLARNKVMNLTAITDPVEVAVKHFVDSLTVETVRVPKAGERAIDIGTGAGFPGVPLAIRHPRIEVVLNDSTRKKVDFLQEAATALHLTNTRPLWARAEELGRQSIHRERYHLAYARAVAHLAMLLEYTLPLLQVGGIFVAMKGPGGAGERAECSRALQALGGVVDEERAITLPGAGDRLLIVVRKVYQTPAKYPRDGSVIKKRPLFLDTGKRDA